MSVNNFSKVILYLTANPNSSVDSISTNLDLRKETIDRILSGLAKDNLVIFVNERYSLSDIFCNLRLNQKSDVYFNFKIKQDDKDKIYFLFSKIKTYLEDTVQVSPNKTQMQKLVIQINNKLNLHLPVAWYKYGQIVPIAYDFEIDYNKMISDNKFNIPEQEIYNIINLNIIGQTKQLRSAKELKLNMYNSGTSEMYQLYQLKDQMLEHCYKDDFNFVRNKFNDLIKLKPYFKDEYNIINDFSDFIIYFAKIYSKRGDYKLKNLFIETFNVFWDYIALHNYMYDMKQYYIENEYNLEDLKVNTLFELNKFKEDFFELLDQFYEDFNITEFMDNPEMKKLMGNVMKDK